MCDVIYVMPICGMISLAAYFISLLLPSSTPRNVLMSVAAGAVAILSAAYVLCSFDDFPVAILGPYRLGGETTALLVAVGSAIAAVDARRAVRIAGGRRSS